MEGKKEIEQMNIEELRAALRESEAARVEAEKALESVKKDKELYKSFWDQCEIENKSLKMKVEAIKVVVSLL